MQSIYITPPMVVIHFELKCKKKEKEKSFMTLFIDSYYIKKNCSFHLFSFKIYDIHSTYEIFFVTTISKIPSSYNEFFSTFLLKLNFNLILFLISAIMVQFCKHIRQNYNQQTNSFSFRYIYTYNIDSLKISELSFLVLSWTSTKVFLL